MKVSVFRQVLNFLTPKRCSRRIPVRRPLLIARWSVAADGVLECRWEQVERKLQR